MKTFYKTGSVIVALALFGAVNAPVANAKVTTTSLAKTQVLANLLKATTASEKALTIGGQYSFTFTIPTEGYKLAETGMVSLSKSYSKTVSPDLNDFSIIVGGKTYTNFYFGSENAQQTADYNAALIALGKTGTTWSVQNGQDFPSIVWAAADVKGMVKAAASWSFVTVKGVTTCILKSKTETDTFKMDSAGRIIYEASTSTDGNTTMQVTYKKVTITPPAVNTVVAANTLNAAVTAWQSLTASASDLTAMANATSAYASRATTLKDVYDAEYLYPAGKGISYKNSKENVTVKSTVYSLMPTFKITIVNNLAVYGN
jgi:hypothetical protein